MIYYGRIPKEQSPSTKTKVSTGKLTLAIEHEPFEDVFPIEKWGFSRPYQRISTGLSLQVGEVGLANFLVR